MQIATAPGTWGVEPPASRPENPPWRRVLGEIASVEFDGIELGPIGYLPAQPQLAELLRAHELQLPVGFVMEPLSREESAEHTIAVATKTCATLAAGGAQVLVLIDALSPIRSATAGRSADATRLGREDWEALVAMATRICGIAGGYGLDIAFHPHAGTFVEFTDEIERLMDDLDAPNAGFCLDSGHAAYAGIDPLELTDLFGARLTHVHLKDLDTTTLAKAIAERRSFEEAVALGVFTPLGRGSLDLERLADRLGEVDYQGWATIEQDRTPETVDDAERDARSSLEHARSIGF